MGKTPVVGNHTRPPDRILYPLADGIIHHGGNNGAPHAETAGKICRYIILPPRNMKSKMIRLRKGDNSGVKPGYQGAQSQEIMLYSLRRRDIQQRHKTIMNYFLRFIKNKTNRKPICVVGPDNFLEYI
jgi:hypothetical protein